MINFKITEEQAEHARSLMENLIEDNIKNNSEECQRITALSDEKLLEEFYYWSHRYAGSCPLTLWSYKNVTANLISREINKRNLWAQAKESGNVKNISCKKCPLASGEEKKENPVDGFPTSGCVAWVSKKIKSREVKK